MSLTPIPFYRMGQHINSGSCCHSRRHGIGQFRINDCCFRIKSFRYNRCLFPICMIRKNRYTGHLTSGSCGSRNRNQRQMFRRKCNPRPMVFPDRILCQSHACSSLCTIHRASASQDNHKSDIILTDNFRTGIHFRDIRIWRYIPEGSNQHSFGFFHNFFCQSTFKKERSGYQKPAGTPQFLRYFFYFVYPSFSKVNLNRL